MNIRQQIIEQLDKPAPGFEYFLGNRYQQLKECLILKPGTDQTNGAIVDEWFKGVIESLYYRPNKNVLVLEGEQGIGKSWFFSNLMPKRVPYTNNFWYVDAGSITFEKYLYSTLITDLEFEKLTLWLPTEENFITYHMFDMDKPVADKRLASYCSTTNKWVYPPRKNFIVLHLESINQELFNSIDKELLWIEIFNKFKPEGK